MDSGFRVEYYIETGIVLLGATLPFTLVIWAGPVAIAQASIVSITTFLVIFFVGRKMGLRTWAYIFCFFSIGLTTRFRELAQTGAKPFWAFTSGVAVNVVLGFVLSAVVFATYWINLSH